MASYIIIFSLVLYLLMVKTEHNAVHTLKILENILLVYHIFHDHKAFYKHEVKILAFNKLVKRDIIDYFFLK